MKNWLLLLQITAVLFIIILAPAQGQTINTLAGTSTAGYMGDGGPSTAAELSQSVGVGIDDSGNVYICDSHNNVIRKITATTGIISTVAGNGINANNVLMDGIPATASELNAPWAVVVDDSGNLYIADYGDEAIRKVTKATGLISTLAGTGKWAFSGDGGPATAAELAPVLGVAVDNSGNVYIADQWNQRIRKITKATGIINTIAGTGTPAFSGDGGPGTAAELAYPSSIVVDDSGNIYIDDQWNNEVRILSQKTGIITRFAGNTAGASGLFSGGYSGDGGLATAAEINFPTGICLDDSNNVYIGDWANEVIRKVSAKTGIITTVAGDGFNAGSSGSGGYSGDGGPATAAELNAPSGVATDKCGNIYIADYENNRVRKVTVNDSAVISVTPPGPSLCKGSSTLLIGGGGISYTWSPATGLSATTGDTITANPTITTTYTLTGYSQCGSGITQVVVTVTPGLKPTITPLSPSVCSGQPLTLTASGGTTFLWSTGSTDSTIIITTTKDTSYYVNVSNGNCSGMDTVIVSVIPAPNKPTISESANNDTLISSATQGNQWFFNDTLINGATNEKLVITGHRKGLFTVEVINPANGCSTTSDTTSSINQLSVISDLLSIYPNPTTSTVFITISTSVQDIKDWNLEMTDVLGQKLYSELSLSHSNEINLSDLPGGVYFIIISNKTGQVVFPVVKQN